MISSAHIVDLKGNVISGHTICPPSFVDIALIFSELRGGAESPPPPNLKRPKKAWFEKGFPYFFLQT